MPPLRRHVRDLYGRAYEEHDEPRQPVAELPLRQQRRRDLYNDPGIDMQRVAVEIGDPDEIALPRGPLRQIDQVAAFIDATNARTGSAASAPCSAISDTIADPEITPAAPAASAAQT